ncbi:formylglycine-generating enzyme family protein [Haloferula sp.]|uniref:formylglycine-generating enzyme family protein n=1 Tax=Haloferula sp. TaxID=2497595 RepID=UPI003C76E8DA
MKTAALILALASCFLRGEEAAGNLPAIPPEMARVEGGDYLPMFGDRDQPRSVAPFLLDRRPVTNAQFLDFVREHPKWQRSKVSRLFAAESYLSHWRGDLELGASAPPDAPVVGVSWFAARAYLKAHGKRLPTEDEWELAARADATRADASTDPAFLARILAWYGKPNPPVLPAVTTAETDFRGVTGMHGLVWEWVRDFNNQMVTGAARNDASLDRALFCAGGALNATDAANYAAFMRYAFRSSLEGNFTVTNLGFRGARDAETAPPKP